VPVEPEVPVGVGGEPVVVTAVEQHGVLVRDAPLGQQVLEAGLVHEVPADRVLQVLLPVDLDRARDVPLVVGAGVLVYLDDDDTRLADVGLRPVGVHEDVGSAHGGYTSLSVPSLGGRPDP
jgi:hypothetical protein